MPGMAVFILKNINSENATCNTVTVITQTQITYSKLRLDGILQLLGQLVNSQNTLFASVCIHQELWLEASTIHEGICQLIDLKMSVGYYPPTIMSVVTIHR